MKYTVEFEIRGYYTAEVEAESLKEAEEVAELHYYDADFGELTNFDSTIINTENEFGIAE